MLDAGDVVVSSPHQAAILVLVHDAADSETSDLLQAMAASITTLALAWFFIMLCHTESKISL